MRNRAVRVSLVLVLVVSGVAAAVAVQGAARQATQAEHLGGSLDDLYAKVAELGVAQTGYLAPGQDPLPWLDRSPGILRDIAAAIARLGPLLRSSGAARALRGFADDTASLTQADALARDSLLLGDTSTAADLIFGETRTTLASMQAALATIRSAETAAVQIERQQAMRRIGVIVAAAAGVWAAGLLVLAVAAPPSRRAERPTGPEPTRDLSLAADLCVDLARVQTTPELEALVGRVLQALDASSVVLWVGAGRDLYPIVAHGYEPGPVPPPLRIDRDDDHLAAQAWRLSAVKAAATTSGSLVAAPLVGMSGCSGALVVEFNGRRDEDSVTRAAIRMIASQLATVVPGPAAADSRARATATGT
jgi:hypothetical protein